MYDVDFWSDANGNGPWILLGASLVVFLVFLWMSRERSR